MFLTNTEEVPGKQITAFYGVVSGSTVRAKHAGRDMMASLKNIFGGELKGYFNNRDHLRSMGRGIVFTALAAFLTGAGSDLTRLFAPTAGFSQAQYSQERERIADQEALIVLNRYYGHIGGAAEFFEAMASAETERNKVIGNYFSSHPQAVNRINNLHRLAEQMNFERKEISRLPPIFDSGK